ncbi:MAG: AMP-binding protein [Sphingobium sp.]
MEGTATKALPLDRDRILPHLIARRAAEQPDRVYLQSVHGDSMTYGAVHNTGLHWADGFGRLGVRRDAAIAILLPNGFDIPLAWLGAAWIGARIVTINPAFRGRMLEHVLAVSGAAVIVTTEELAERLTSIDVRATALTTGIFVDRVPAAPDHGLTRVVDKAAFLEGTQATPREGPEPHDIAAVIFTSGTTGPSKAVAMHWAQLHSTSSDPMLDAMGPDDRWYSPLPMFHISGLGPLYRMALAGGQVVVRELFSASEYFSDIRKFGITGAVLIESMFQILMKSAAQGETKPPTLKYVTAVPVPAYIDQFIAQFGVQVGTMYNMTELGGPICSNGFSVTGADAGSCGRVRDGFEARIVDDLDYPVADGQAGELVIRPLRPWTTATSYLNNPAATAQAWRNGWFHTGDVFRRDAEGRYYFVDRLKDAIRRRGENISSAEVEAEVLANAEVRECAAVPFRTDDGSEEVKIFIVPTDAERFDPRALIEYLIPRMPHFMVPRFVEAIAELPRTASHKIQKHMLRDLGNGSDRTWDREAAGIVLKSRRSG